MILGSELLIVLLELGSDELLVNLSVGFSEAFVARDILKYIVRDIEV